MSFYIWEFEILSHILIIVLRLLFTFYLHPKNLPFTFLRIETHSSVLDDYFLLYFFSWLTFLSKTFLSFTFIII